MTVVEAFTLGLVQGLTEFLPISSTAHLRVVPALLGWEDPGAMFSAVIQLGSVFAVFTYFWQDLWAISKGAVSAWQRQDFADRDWRIAGAIAIGTVPICVLGFALKSVLEQPGGPLRSLSVVAVASIVMGLLLLLAERFARRERSIDEMGVKDGLLMGLGQALALIPGCSRSGSTLTVALFLNMRRDDAARFSFLLGIPAIALSGLLELYEMLKAGVNGSQFLHLAVGLASSTIFSYLAIAWLIKYLRTHSTAVFIVYRLVFGVAVLLLAWQGLIR